LIPKSYPIEIILILSHSMVKRIRDIKENQSLITEERIMRKWSLPQEVHRSIYKREVDKTLGYLSNLTSGSQHTLFPEDEESYRRYVGAFRVQLLMEWGYYREALAWTCLECELYPENMKAFIFKESIK
jgi:hypothetical protein